jgi:16S rRNA (adenine1518-N6/adenine1519-N6)-dimethyltransferase
VSHRPRKRFGQHFLIDPEVIEKIVSAIAPRDGEIIVEIGPGQAAITEPLSILASELHAVEFDRDLAAKLRERYSARDNVTIHEADALEFDFSSLGERLRVVGNLPYNISTPLLFRLLDFREHLVDAHFMLQKEVVDRLCASPGNKSFGRLTVMLGCHMESVPLFDVPPDAFSPPPRVTSSVVRMRPLPPDRYDLRDPGMLERLVKLAFSRRRKTLRNALQGMVDPAMLEEVGLDPGWRPEQVPIEAWITLVNQVS